MKVYNEDQMTQFYPADVSPAHVGVYQRGYLRQQTEYRYWYWNGTFWECGAWDTPEQAAQNPRKKSGQPELFWRGLLARPATNEEGA